MERIGFTYKSMSGVVSGTVVSGNGALNVTIKRVMSGNGRSRSTLIQLNGTFEIIMFWWPVNITQPTAKNVFLTPLPL